MPPELSKRTERLLEKGKTSVLGAALFKTFANQYSTVNPQGVVNAGLAENSLMHDWLTEFFERSLLLDHADFTYGTSLVGSHRLFASLIPFYTTYIHPHVPLEASHIATANGLTTLLDHLASVLCDPGEAFIIPRPYYNAFEADLQGRSEVEVVGVEIPRGQHGEMGEVEALEREMVRRQSEGGARVKAVLVTNPHNPLGFCYKRSSLLAYARFAEKWDLFLISDEIYATSIYESDLLDAAPFVSILSLDVLRDGGCNPARIIQLYGMSKDFGANGFRIGTLVSQHNSKLHQGLWATAMTMKIGSPSDALWSALLTSPQLPTYIQLNQQRLGEAYTFVTSWLQQHNLPYRPANAGHFVLVDLRQHLAKASMDGKADISAEVSLLEKLVDAGVYLGPGFSYGVSTPGFFRLTFSIRREDLVVGLQRIEQVLGLPSPCSHHI